LATRTLDARCSSVVICCSCSRIIFSSMCRQLGVVKLFTSLFCLTGAHSLCQMCYILWRFYIDHTVYMTSANFWKRLGTHNIFQEKSDLEVGKNRGFETRW
jgi:glucose-6-phosphate-specific signal transduction histidine kinase